MHMKQALIKRYINPHIIRAHTYSTHQSSHTQASALSITCGRITWGHGEGKRPEEKRQNKREGHSSTCRLRERERHYQRNWVSVKIEGGEWLFKGVRWVWEGLLKEERKGGNTEGERKGVEVERRRHGARREAEGRRGTDQKQHLWTDGPFEISEQLISSSRFTVSLPRPSKWVTRGRVPSLTQPTDLLNICIKVRALPSLPHQYSLSA